MTSLSSVFVEVRPDTSHFSTDLKRSLARTREAVEVAASLDTAKLKPQLDRLKTDLKSITVTKANITADSARASATVRGLKQELKGLSEKVKLEGDSTDLSDRIAAVKAELKSVSDEKVKLSVDSSAASAHIKALTAQLGVFSREEDNAGGGRDGGGLGSHLAGIASGFADAGAAMGSIMTKAGMVGPALLAAGAAASSAASAGVALAGAMGPVAAAGIAAYGGSMLAVKQGMGVVKFATEGLTDAIGGDEEAMKKLTPAGRDLARQLKGMKPEVEGVRQAAQAGLFPGVADAARRLATNYFPLLRTAARQTGESMGGLAERAGLLASSGPWKRDFGTVTSTNARNLSVLGTIGLSLADVFRNLLVTSLPLTTAFLRWGAGAARALQGVTQAGRESGALAGFWTRAAAAGAVFGRIVGNVGVALFNVFRIGSSPTGRNLLVVVEGLTARFREWTTTANGAKAIAQWFATGRANVAAIGRLVGAVFGGMKDMGSGAAFAPLVDQIRTQVLPPLMAFLHNASASGALQALVKAVGNILDVFAQLSASDQSLKAFAATLGALARAAGWIVENVPGASKVLGAFFVLLGANQALKVVGLGGAVRDLGGLIASLATQAGRAALKEKALAFWTGAQALASKAAAAAAKTWAGMQWLLNAAMAANPLGLIVIGIAALVGGFILAYKKSETFRNIVNGALNAVKDAAGAVTRWFKRSFVPFFTDTIPGAFAATKRWVSRNWPTILGIITGPIGWATLFITRHWDTITNAFKDAKDWAVGTFKRAWSAVQGVLAAPVRAARDVFSDIFGSGGPVRRIFNGIKNFMVGAFKREWAGLKAIFTDPVQAAKNAFQNILGPRGPVRTAFTNAVGGIKRIWSNLRDAIRDPIAFIVNTVFNKGIVPFVNRIPFIKGELHTIQGFAGGGYTGPGAKNEPAGIVHRDEHVWTKEESNRFPGGHQGLERLRARARAGALREGEFAGREMLPGYATGGRVLMDGKALSVIAARQIRLMERMAGVNFRVMQGGYGGSNVRASGTSHNYPGVADFSPASIQYERLARRVGFAAWARNIPGRSSVGSGAHIHAVSLLDPGDARSPQVYGSWRNHGNGLRGANNDPAPHVPWLPNLKQLLGNIPLANLGGGGGGGGGYTGPSAADVRAGLNPAKWVRTLAGMGGWGRGLGGMVTGVVGNLRDAIIDKVKAAIAVAGRALTGGAGPVSGPVSQAVRRVANTYGWGQGDEWNALSNIISHESSWDPNAKNRNSSARGLFQKMTSLHGPIERTVEGQAVWGLNYIKDRYGDPIGAWEHWQRNRSYDGGGVARGRGVMVKDTIGPERVLTDRQTDTYDKLLPILERIERGGTGTGPVRIVLDAGGGVTLTGHIDNRIRGRAAQSATVRRQRR